ncbi:MAG: hypothetical protein HC860_23655, partial [Alkalinema sp. RU_4_3]|nr:hypothetical protein [Alkalinema sp. RU_4_3]
MELKVIAILAGVFAAIGLVVFGRSKDEPQAVKPAVERVEPARPVETPPPLLTEPIAEPMAAEPEPIATEPMAEAIISTETPVEETPMPVAAFKAATQARAMAATQAPRQRVGNTSGAISSHDKHRRNHSPTQGRLSPGRPLLRQAGPRPPRNPCPAKSQPGHPS